MENKFVVKVPMGGKDHEYEIEPSIDEDGKFYRIKHICPGPIDYSGGQIKSVKQPDGTYSWFVNDDANATNDVIKAIGKAIESFEKGST